LLEEKQKHEAQREVDSLKKQLEAKNKEVGGLTVHVQKLNEDLEGKKKEVYSLIADLKEEKKKREKLRMELNTSEKEVERLTAELKEENKEREKLQKELNTKDKEVDDLNADVKRLTEEKKKSEDDLQKQPHEERQRDGSSSAERPVIEVDRLGKYIRVRNTSCQDQRLGGWKLKSQINNEKPDSFTFDPSFILKSRKTVTMWVPSFGFHYPPTDLIWTDLKSWSTKDHLQIYLFSDTGEIKSKLKFTEK
ncbi:hypothetical protein L3Q82_016495, partial [Scortum barcoo]